MNAFTHNLIGRMLEPVFAVMPPNASKMIADFHADESLQSRIEYLAAQANEGELTPDELAEYESYIAAGDILATLQAIARRKLNSPED